jgi:hypothetical protein
MPRELTLTLDSRNDHATAWAKVVTGVDLSQPGGMALKGTWLGKEHKGTNAVEFNVLTAINKKMPIVVGASLYGESLDILAKHEQPIKERIACVITIDHSASFSQYKLNDAHIVEGKVVSYAEPDYDNGVGLSKEYDELQEKFKDDNVFSMPNRSPNPFFWAAVYIKLNFPDLAGLDISKIAPRHKELHPRDTIFEDGERVTVPEGYVFLSKIGDIWLMGERTNGAKNLSFMDVFANFDGVLDEEVLDLIERQANDLEALAMTYRIVALSQKNRDVSQD